MDPFVAVTGWFGVIEWIEIKAKVVLKFRIAKAAKDAVLAKK